MTHDRQQCARRVAHPPWFCPDHRAQAPAVGQVGFDGGVQRPVFEEPEVRGRLAPKSRTSAGPLQDALLVRADPEDDPEDALPGM